jgi:hypothetical protein
LKTFPSTKEEVASMSLSMMNHRNMLYRMMICSSVDNVAGASILLLIRNTQKSVKKYSSTKEKNLTLKASVLSNPSKRHTSFKIREKSESCKKRLRHKKGHFLVVPTNGK